MAASLSLFTALQQFYQFLLHGGLGSDGVLADHSPVILTAATLMPNCNSTDLVFGSLALCAWTQSGAIREISAARLSTRGPATKLVSAA